MKNGILNELISTMRERIPQDMNLANTLADILCMGVVYLGRYHQIPLFRVYYCECVCFLRIYGGRRFYCCGKGFHGFRSVQ